MGGVAYAKKEKLYVASRASVPERAVMWQKLRNEGHEIVSSWIDESGPSETLNYYELWARIQREISSADRLIFYAEYNDFPLKGAFVEVGIALGMNKRVTICLPGVVLDGPTFRPIGSWIKHPLVNRQDDLQKALTDL